MAPDQSTVRLVAGLLAMLAAVSIIAAAVLYWKALGSDSDAFAQAAIAIAGFTGLAGTSVGALGALLAVSGGKST